MGWPTAIYEAAQLAVRAAVSVVTTNCMWRGQVVSKTAADVARETLCVPSPSVNKPRLSSIC